MIAYRKTLLIGIVYLLLSAVVTYMYTVRPGANTDFRHSETAMLNGSAHKPFVFRTLIPILTNAIVGVTPPNIKSAVNNVSSGTEYDTRIDDTLKMLVWQKDHIFSYVVIATLQCLSFFGFALTLRVLILRAYNCSAIAADVIPLIALIFFTTFLIYGLGYVYDPSTLLFAALGLLAISLRRRALFYAVLALATINRETACLLIAFFAVDVFHRKTLKDVFPDLILQCIIFAGIQIAIRSYYMGNQGGGLEFHLFENINDYVQAPGVGLVYIVGMITLFAIPVIWSWNRTPLFYRHCLIIGLAFLVPAWILVTRMAEMRTFIDIYPILAVLSVPWTTESLEMK